MSAMGREPTVAYGWEADMKLGRFASMRLQRDGRGGKRMAKSVVITAIVSLALTCAACASTPSPYAGPLEGSSTAKITYHRIGNAVPGYFGQDLQISHDCTAFMQLAAFPRGDRDVARNEPKTVDVEARTATCFKLHMDEVYPMHGLASCDTVFEIDLTPGSHFIVRHLYEAAPGQGNSIRYRCSPLVEDALTGRTIEVRLIPQA